MFLCHIMVGFQKQKAMGYRGIQLYGFIFYGSINSDYSPKMTPMVFWRIQVFFYHIQSC